jgi:hypothetical protein
MIDPTTHLILVQTAVEETTKDMDQTELLEVWNAAVKLVTKIEGFRPMGAHSVS